MAINDTYNTASAEMRRVQAQPAVGYGGNSGNNYYPNDPQLKTMGGSGPNQPYPQQMKPPQTDVYTYNAPQPVVPTQPYQNPNVVVGGGRQTSPYGSRSSGGFGGNPGQSMVNTMRSVGNMWQQAAGKLPQQTMGRFGSYPATPRAPVNFRNAFNRLGGQVANRFGQMGQQAQGAAQTVANRSAIYGGAGQPMGQVPQAEVARRNMGLLSFGGRNPWRR